MNWYGQSIATGGGNEKPLDQFLYDRYFVGKTDGVAIECGANDGLYLSTCFAFEQMGWRVINIEASAMNAVKLFGNRPQSENHYLALYHKDFDSVPVENLEFDNGGANRLVGYGGEYGKNEKVNFINKASTIRYDTFINTFINQPIDLFVLDVEGSELMVIEGMKKTRFWPKVFCIEHAHIDFCSMCDLLYPEKYRLDYKDNLNAVFVL